MMHSKLLLLSVFMLAQQPAMYPSSMRETYVHPSVQAFGLDNNNTTRVPSPVDFVGTVEMEPPKVVPSTSSPIMDAIESTMSFAKEVKSTDVSVAAKDLYYEIYDGKIVFIDDEFQQIINNVWADFLVASAPFRYGTVELLAEMPANFVQSIMDVKSTVSVAAKDFYYEIYDAKIVFIDDEFQQIINNVWADFLVASAPFRYGTTELFDEIMSLSFAQFSGRVQGVVQDLSDVMDSKYQQVFEDFETVIGQLHQSQEPQRSNIQDILNKISQEMFDCFAPAPAYPRLVAAEVIIHRAYAKLGSVVFTAPEPVPSRLESIGRNSLYRIFLEYQRVTETVEVLRHHLFATATPPPTFWVQRITTTAYEKLESFVNYLFTPPPPPPRTIQSMVTDVLKTVSEGYEQAYEKLENHFAHFLVPPPPSPGGLGSITIMDRFHATFLQYERVHAKMEMVYRQLPRFIFSMDLMLPKLRCDLVLEESLFKYRDWIKFEERLANGRPSEYPQTEPSL